MPQTLTDSMWIELLKCDSLKSRETLYEKYADIQVRCFIKTFKEKKTTLGVYSDSHHVSWPTLKPVVAFLKHYNLEYRLLNAVKYSPEIFIDLHYERRKDDRSNRNYSKEISKAIKENLYAPEPFHLTMSNTMERSALKPKIMSELEEFSMMTDIITKVVDRSFSHECVFDLKPKSSLIYLVPDEGSPFSGYQPNKTYIIGGGSEQTIARARKHGVRMEQFPLKYRQVLTNT